MISFLVAQTVKNPPAIQETPVRPLGQEDPLQRKWLPTPVFLPGEFHGQRSLAGYNDILLSHLSSVICATVLVTDGEVTNHPKT